MQAALPSKFQSGILASPRQQARFLRLDRCVAAYLSLSALVWHRLRQGRTRRLGVRCAQGQNPGARCLSRPAEGPVRRESETNSAKLRRQSSGSGALSQSGREQNARPAEAAGSAGTPLNGASAGRLQRVSLALGARVQGRLGGGGGGGARACPCPFIHYSREQRSSSSPGARSCTGSGASAVVLGRGHSPARRPLQAWGAAGVACVAATRTAREQPNRNLGTQVDRCRRQPAGSALTQTQLHTTDPVMTHARWRSCPARCSRDQAGAGLAAAGGGRAAAAPPAALTAAGGDK